MTITTDTPFERLKRYLEQEQIKADKDEPSGYSVDPVAITDSLDIYHLELPDGAVVRVAFGGEELYWFEINNVPVVGAVRITPAANTQNWGTTAGGYVDKLLADNDL